MVVKVYGDRLSQPSRAIIIFCKINGIEFEEIRTDILKNQHHSPEYKEINPMRQIPAIVDGDLKLFESHAILIYLSCAYPQVASTWYPDDVYKRAKIHSVLDWHHNFLRRGAAGFIFNTVLAPLSGIHSYPQVIIQVEEILLRSLSKLEHVWLKDGPFLAGNSQPSIADLLLACEIMQLELLSEKDRHRILSPYVKVVKWVEDTKSAVAPHFDEAHELLFESQKRFREQMATKAMKTQARSKM
ncbi:hypothetical protein QVD17_02001 [Tagetes erecta]|uniref:glutathione transferase n=1 Tax=Tagetes erecta TaxID=13708 RepID=A0AAD8LAT8_TARER|nr:hypothetical protein QVD17_02001 [Tagetes erecta]